jgi:hypothetical protein
MKFNQLVDSILREGIGDPEAAAAAAAAGNAALSHRFSSYNPQPAPTERQRADDQAPTRAHYQVSLSPEGKAKYQKALEFIIKQKPELAPLKRKMEACKYSYRTFAANAREAATKFADKYGIRDEAGAPKEPVFVAR